METLDQKIELGRCVKTLHMSPRARYGDEDDAEDEIEILTILRTVEAGCPVLEELTLSGFSSINLSPLGVSKRSTPIDPISYESTDRV